jgi:uncharacterized protein (DUF1501 family)
MNMLIKAVAAVAVVAIGGCAVHEGIQLGKRVRATRRLTKARAKLEAIQANVGKFSEEEIVAAVEEFGAALNAVIAQAGLAALAS